MRRAKKRLRNKRKTGKPRKARLNKAQRAKAIGRRRTKAAGKAPGAAVSGSTFDQGYDKGYNEGYEKAALNRSGQHEEAVQADSYERGYRAGKHDGGDGVIDSLMPEWEILPELTAEDVIRVGVEALRDRRLRLLTAEEVGDAILRALEQRQPMSLVRLGDGELLTLAQDTVMSAEQVKAAGPFLPYAGIRPPDLGARDALHRAVLSAGIVGVPKLRQPNYQPLAFAVFRAYGIDYRSLRLTDSLVNYYLHHRGYVARMAAGRRVLLVGNKAEPFAERLRASGVIVPYTVSPVDGVGDVDRVFARVSGLDFDLALVSAGIAAVPLAQRIASELGKVAIDFGHLADAFVKGEATL